ncbi:MAG: hypothetical protein HC897_02310 [Thermoanaerobaculia bacterium]|nr:hypothetical protein [Thermoanaerobaculia bacterium]
MGLWIAFLFVAAVFALMGWSVYSTHRKSPTETVEESESFVVGRLDAVDALLVLATWFAFPFVLGSWLDTFMATRYSGWALLAGAAAGAVWLRRRWFPGTVIRFDRKNVALRSAAIFCALAATIALLFGAIAGWLEEPSSVAWSFFLTAGGLASVAACFHALEFRRRPGPCPEVPEQMEREAARRAEPRRSTGRSGKKK